MKQSLDEGHRSSYIHEVRHDFCIIDIDILRIVTLSLNRHSPGGLDQPAGKRSLAELGSLRSETEEAAFLGWRVNVKSQNPRGRDDGHHTPLMGWW